MSGGAAGPALDRITGEVLRSRRYRWIAPQAVTRLAAEALPGSRNEAEAVKRTKRRLHQACGAYLSDLRPEEILDRLRAARDRGGTPGLREATRDVLARHASTRERLPVLEAFYRSIFERTGTPGVLLDVACGLGPLAWPWMGLPAGTAYHAYDVDRRLVDLVDGFLTLCEVPHVATLRDVIADPPAEPADVALLLKAAPCLEAQSPGSPARLLRALGAAPVRCVVLSYPARSLGGSEKGMVDHYRRQVDGLVDEADWSRMELSFPAETVYLLTRR